VFGVLGFPGVDRSLLLFQAGAALDGQSQAQPAAKLIIAGALQLLDRQAGDQRPDSLVVTAGLFAGEHGRQEHSFAGSGQRLAVRLQGLGANQLGAHLLLQGQFAQTGQARVVQGSEGSLGIVARQGQLGRQGAGIDLRARLEQGQVDLAEYLRGAQVVALSGSLIRRTQAQQGCLLGRLGRGGLFQQLLDARIRCARQFSQVGRGGAGASGQ
jgi:hypothetical protein